MATARIVRIHQTGEVQVFIDGPVTFQQAAQISQAIMAAIGAEVAITVTSQPEQHKLGVDHVHLAEHHAAPASR